MLCYVAIPRVPATELAALQNSLRNNLDAFVTASEGWDKVYVQACTEDQLGKPLADVMTFLTNHGYAVSVVGVASDGQPNPMAPFGVCSQTGQYFPTTQLIAVPAAVRGQSRLVNREYHAQHYFQCCRCHRANENAQRRVVPSGEGYCLRCFEDYCRTCPECERVVWEHEMEYCDDEDGDEELVCRRCLSQTRGEQFCGQDKTFRRANTFGSSRKFGIELETNRGTASDQFAFDAKDDGSISGWEFVSHVLRGDEGLEEVRQFMASGHNIRVGNNCGMHLHFSVGDLENDEKYAVAAAFYVTQRWWFSQVESHRRSNSYCREQSADSMFLNMKTAKERGTTFQGFAGAYERYLWLNIGDSHGHGTFENRLHHATWDFAQVKRWIILHLRFVRAARELRIEANDTVATFKAKADRCIAFALEHFGESLPNVQPLQLASA